MCGFVPRVTPEWLNGSAVVVTFGMLDLDFRVSAVDLDLVISLVHVSRKVGKSKLPVQQERKIAKERIQADRRERPLEKCPPAGFVGEFLKTALSRQNCRSNVISSE